MITQMWHALDQISEAVTHVGGRESLHASIFEASHNSFKSMYANSSGFKCTAMSEVVFKRNAETLKNIDSFMNSTLKRTAINGSVEVAQNAKSCRLARL